MNLSQEREYGRGDLWTLSVLTRRSLHLQGFRLGPIMNPLCIRLSVVVFVPRSRSKSSIYIQENCYWLWAWKDFSQLTLGDSIIRARARPSKLKAARTLSLDGPSRGAMQFHSLHYLSLIAIGKSDKIIIFSCSSLLVTSSSTHRARCSNADSSGKHFAVRNRFPINIYDRPGSSPLRCSIHEQDRKLQFNISYQSDVRLLSIFYSNAAQPEIDEAAAGEGMSETRAGVTG